jgi:hypothetical protein
MENESSPKSFFHTHSTVDRARHPWGRANRSCGQINGKKPGTPKKDRTPRPTKAFFPAEGGMRRSDPSFTIRLNIENGFDLSRDSRRSAFTMSRRFSAKGSPRPRRESLCCERQIQQVRRRRRKRSKELHSVAWKGQAGRDQFYQRACATQTNRLRAAGRIFGNRKRAGQVVHRTSRESETVAPLTGTRYWYPPLTM